MPWQKAQHNSWRRSPTRNTLRNLIDSVADAKIKRDIRFQSVSQENAYPSQSQFAYMYTETKKVFFATNTCFPMIKAFDKGYNFQYLKNKLSHIIIFSSFLHFLIIVLNITDPDVPDVPSQTTLPIVKTWAFSLPSWLTTFMERRHRQSTLRQVLNRKTRPSGPICAPCGSSKECVTDRPTYTASYS